MHSIRIALRAIAYTYGIRGMRACVLGYPEWGPERGPFRVVFRGHLGLISGYTSYLVILNSMHGLFNKVGSGMGSDPGYHLGVFRGYEIWS